jgi:hypothetical protein
MNGISWRKLFMKRLFFVLLFALTTLVFSACSSSGGGGGGGNGSHQPTPQNIEGTVIIPSGYTGNNIQVCDDKNNSNSCDSGETTVAVDSNGSFSISAAYSLVAEFYSEPRNTSGTSVSSWNGHLPMLVYTTPAGESSISAFTTMVKNKIDTQPGLYNAISGAEKVKTDTTITFDPFDAGSYNTNAVLNYKVSAVAEGILEYICNTLNINSDTFSPGVILALYNVVYDIADDIAANPSSADVDNLVNTNKGIIDDTAIAAADNAVGEVWNVGNTISGLYEFWFSGRVNKVVVGIGNENAEAHAIALPTGTLPSPESANVDSNQTIRATVASPANITTSERFSSKTFNLGAEAKVYTLIITYDYSKSVQSAEYLQHDAILDFDLFTGDDMDIVITYGFDRTFTVTDIIMGNNTISFIPNRGDTSGSGNYPQSGEFVWKYKGKTGPFSNKYPFTKSGSFIKTAYNDEEAFKLTDPSDGSTAILFKYNSGWVLATYPIFEESLTLFNEAAAQTIVDQWKTEVTPLW